MQFGTLKKMRKNDQNSSTLLYGKQILIEVCKIQFRTLIKMREIEQNTQLL